MDEVAVDDKGPWRLRSARDRQHARPVIVAKILDGQGAVRRMAEGLGVELLVPIRLLKEILVQVSGFIGMEQDQAGLVEERESVTEGQNGVNQNRGTRTATPKSAASSKAVGRKKGTP